MSLHLDSSPIDKCLYCGPDERRFKSKSLGYHTTSDPAEARAAIQSSG